jgi:hypothetical protein
MHRPANRSEYAAVSKPAPANAIKLNTMYMKKLASRGVRLGQGEFLFQE